MAQVRVSSKSSFSLSFFFFFSVVPQLPVTPPVLPPGTGVFSPRSSAVTLLTIPLLVSACDNPNESEPLQFTSFPPGVSPSPKLGVMSCVDSAPSPVPCPVCGLDMFGSVSGRQLSVTPRSRVGDNWQ